MADANVKIKPLRLSAALRDAGLAACDTSTTEGERHAAGLVSSMMESEDKLDRLLVALERDGLKDLSSAQIPTSFGAVVMKTDAIQSEPDWDLPPVGSPEADSFIDEALAADSGVEGLSVDLETMPPSILGFSEDKAEPVPAGAAKKFDNILRDAQNNLALQVKSLRRPSFWARVYTAAFSSESQSEPFRYATKVVKNYTVVEAKQAGHKKLIMKSVASGAVFFVQVEIDGRVALKDRIALSDPSKATRQISELFDGQAEIGASVLHELREANSTMIKKSWAKTRFGI